MPIYSIKKELNIANYKITKIIFKNEIEIHLRMEPYKKKRVIRK